MRGHGAAMWRRDCHGRGRALTARTHRAWLLYLRRDRRWWRRGRTSGSILELLAFLHDVALIMLVLETGSASVPFALLHLVVHLRQSVGEDQPKVKRQLRESGRIPMFAHSCTEARDVAVYENQILSIGLVLRIHNLYQKQRAESVRYQHGKTRTALQARY